MQWHLQLTGVETIQAHWVSAGQQELKLFKLIVAMYLRQLTTTANTLTHLHTHAHSLERAHMHTHTTHCFPV